MQLTIIQRNLIHFRNYKTVFVVYQSLYDLSLGTSSDSYPTSCIGIFQFSRTKLDAALSIHYVSFSLCAQDSAASCLEILPPLLDPHFPSNPFQGHRFSGSLLTPLLFGHMCVHPTLMYHHLHVLQITVLIIQRSIIFFVCLHLVDS